MVLTKTAWQLSQSGERGIWTLAPVLPTYSLSRGAPSASLGISPCRYLQSKFLNIIIFSIWFQEKSLCFSDLRSGEDGIRTHVPVRTNGFQDRRVMTTSLPLQTVAQHLLKSWSALDSLARTNDILSDSYSSVNANPKNILTKNQPFIPRCIMNSCQ